MPNQKRLAIVVSHPIQHFVGFYRALAAHARLDVKVFYASRIGVESYFDDEMLTDIRWDMDLLSDYSHEFLPDAEKIKEISFGTIDSPALPAALDVFDPDAVLVYGYSQRNSWRAMRWARRNRRKVLMISDSELLQKRNRLLAAPKGLLIKAAYSMVDAFLSVGDRNEEYYRNYGVPQSKIFRSPFTIDETSFRLAAEEQSKARLELRGELGLDEEALVALFVGKLSARKRPQDLLDAVARIKQQGGPIVHAVLAGSGAGLDELKKRTEEEDLPAHFLGFCNLDRLPGLYVAADMLVHTSSRDPHPLVCSEAACVGLPVILSDRIGAEGPTDIARKGENALVYPVGDVGALADAISALARDAAMRDEMSRRALEIFSELDIDRSVRGVIEALDS
ncbi:MAG: glycosyltransferase family 4 protein [Sphingomonadaceae bacterium]